MSKLEQFINDLCPDGVEYKKIKEISEYRRGSFPQPYTNQNYYGGQNAMPFVQVVDMLDDSFNLVDQTKQTISTIAMPKSIFVKSGTILVSIQGTIGKVAIAQYDCYVDRTILIFNNITEKLLKKYFAYVLKQKFEYEKQFARGSTLKTITKKELSEFQIPVPPVEVQKEIVRILDDLSERTAKLTAELTAELTARKRQYEYYKDTLLTFSNDIERKSLQECTKTTNNIKWAEHKEKEFQYIDLSSVSRADNKISETQCINSESAPSRAQQIVYSQDVIFGSTRPMLKRYCLISNEYHNQICSTGFCVLRANTDLVLPKWIFFMISTNNFYKHIEKYQKGASYPAISDSEIKSYKIVVPPIYEQQRIIDILDRFDRLCNNISERLSAEIETRQKQYEYYRDKLLTFKNKEVAENE